MWVWARQQKNWRKFVIKGAIAVTGPYRVMSYMPIGRTLFSIVNNSQNRNIQAQYTYKKEQ